VYAWQSLKPLAVLHEHSDTVQTVSFASGDQLGLLASGGKDCKIAVYELYRPQRPVEPTVGVAAPAAITAAVPVNENAL